MDRFRLGLRQVKFYNGKDLIRIKNSISHKKEKKKIMSYIEFHEKLPRIPVLKINPFLGELFRIQSSLKARF